MLSITERVKQRLGDEQARAGFDLVASSVFNAVAGLAFWLVAARSFDESVVGLNAVAITTIALVESFATLGMKNALIRFMPLGSHQAQRFVRRTYGIAVLVAMVVSPIVALAAIDRVDGLAEVDPLTAAAVFAASCMVWVIFVLQDSVLVALRRTPLIPLSNLAYAVLKLLALVLLTLVTFPWAILVAWVAPLVIIVVAVNTVIVREVAALDTLPEETPTPGLVRFAMGEFSSHIVSMGLFSGLPIVVLASLGERSNAFYGLAFTIAYSLMLANSNMSTALLAAASRRPGHLREQTRNATKQMAMLVVPASIAVVVLAPLGLSLFGSNYSTEGSTLLRLLALTAIANIPVAAAIGVLRARRQPGRLLAMHAVRTSVIFLLCLGLSSTAGLTGVGWGWLAGEGIVALLALMVLRSPPAEPVGDPDDHLQRAQSGI